MDEMIYKSWGGHNKPPVREIVAAIEYRDDRPFSVMTINEWEHGGKSGISADSYDFEWCKRDALLYYDATETGPLGGFCVSRFVNPNPPLAKIWLKDGIKATPSWKDSDEPFTESELLEMGYLLIAEPLTLDLGWGTPSPNPFDHAIEGDCVQCVKCDDLIPEDNICEHMAWCDECGDWHYVEDRSFNFSEGKCEHTDERQD